MHKRTKSTPLGSIDYPINPAAFALGSNASFVARSMDRDPTHLKAMLHRCEQHEGTSFLEIYQNCNIFNDGAFFAFTEKKSKADTCIFLEDGQPLVFGSERTKGIRLDGFRPQVVDLNAGTYNEGDLWIHDEKDIYKAYALSRFFDDPNEAGALPRPFGVLYSETRPTYEFMMYDQIEQVRIADVDLDAMIAGPTTWQIK
jgi:2-oxoglutarate ferredoxin oxidoreductase subunit beta